MNGAGGAPSRGRGAGINKPAWLAQQEREHQQQHPAGDEEDLFAAAAARTANDDDETYGAAHKQDHGDGDGDNNKDERDHFGRAGRGGSARTGGRRDDYRDDRRRGGVGGDYADRHRGGGRRDRGGHRTDNNRGNRSGICFHSYEEERAWLEERRRKRRSRKSLFDVVPSPEQLAEEEARAALEQDHLLMTGGMGIGGGGTDGSMMMHHTSRGGGGGGLQPQQTRHARRLYVGNIPDINDNDLHNFFRDAIRSSIIIDSYNPNNQSHQKQYVENDPIISVYINKERRFAFLEFKTMEITTACLDLDGINIMGHGKVTIKRPNDYNPALAPTMNTSSLPKLDVSKLGIVSTTVPDGPNKIFIGGLPYHLTESQVLELLGAFGVVKAFHLVKSEPTASTSKGYCFVEYADPKLTQLACMGLNGMDMGGGKQLSCRMAVQGYSSADDSGVAAIQQIGGGTFADPVAAPSAAATVVDGFDVDALLSAALGGGGGGAALPPTGSTMMHIMNPMPVMQPLQAAVVDPMTVANMLDAALGASAATVGGPAGSMLHQSFSATPQPTRVLVLLNMVMDEDIANDDDYTMLEEEVREEVGKYGNLLSMKIPRPQDGYPQSAVKKIFLEYATASDAMNAEKELKGRAFGPNIVDASYFNEENYRRNALS